MPKHIYVIDTCVLLHDPHAIYKFEDNDIYIPLAVIDDLDDLKTKRENVGWAAREVLRQLNKFSINDLTRGVKINSKNGKLFVYNNTAPLQKNEMPAIIRTNSDNALIEACAQLKSKHGRRKVCLVTKDVGLMVRAASWNVTTENYRNDLISADIFKGYSIVHIDSKALIDEFYANGEISLERATEMCGDKIGTVHPNQFVIFKYMDASAVTIFKNKTLINCFGKQPRMSFMGISPKNLEQKLSTYLLQDDDIPMVCLSGAAGTGKSISSVAVGLQKIRDGIYEKMVVIKPLMPVGGKEIGYLPGDKFSKIVAWLGPIKDNIEQLVSLDTDAKSGNDFEEMCERGTIEVEAMTFIQGRSITNAFIILDESENVSPREARMLVERAGKNSKVVLLGDLSQIENPYLDQYSCGLTHAIQGGKYSELAGSVELVKVERSALAAAATEIFLKGLDS
jgi:PhoH-like ATPase